MTELALGYYPRIIKLHHRSKGHTLLATFQNGSGGEIYRSTDNGTTFHRLSVIPSANSEGQSLCCVELFEFPTKLGRFPAGTLLWAGSLTTQSQPRQMRLDIWRSENGGASWSPHGTCRAASGGLWEPKFIVAQDGSLVCLFSDETRQPEHSQVISETVSTDGGLTFGPPRDVVVLQSPYLRPGMPTTVKLPDGVWRMTYEVCGASPNCEVRSRTSPDGINWGDPTEFGAPISSNVGSYFTHTPVLSWAPFGGRLGTLILSGQVFNEANGSVSASSGRILLENRSGGAGPWVPIAAPVPIGGPFNENCSNYSSPVSPIHGTRLLEFATGWDGNSCQVFFGQGELPKGRAP
jgi:hypothetical protein